MGSFNTKHTRFFSAFAKRNCLYTTFPMIFSGVAVFFLFKVRLPKDCHNIVLNVQVVNGSVSHYNIPRPFVSTP